MKKLWNWIVRRLARADAVSVAWLQNQRRLEMQEGWEGPRWLSPAEIEALRYEGD